MKQQDKGASLSATGPSQAEPEVSALRASVPSAGDEDSYRMNPAFRRLLNLLNGNVMLAAAAWGVAFEFFRPSDPDGEAEYEVWQDDEMVAGCSGPRARAMAEAVHYAVVYQTDGKPCVIQEVTRREVDPDEAHKIIASGIAARSDETPAAAQPERQEPGPQGDAQQPKDPSNV